MSAFVYSPRRSPKRRCPGLPDSCFGTGYQPYCRRCTSPRYRHRCGRRITEEEHRTDGRCMECYVLTK